VDRQYARVVRQISRYYRRLPQLSRIAVLCLICALIFKQAEYLGETFGATLYYLTH
jgi:hypothetical protein